MNTSWMCQYCPVWKRLIPTWVAECSECPQSPKKEKTECEFCGFPLKGRQNRLCRYCRFREQMARERSHGWKGANPEDVLKDRKREVEIALQYPEGDRPFWWSNDKREARWLAEKLREQSQTE